MERNLLPQKMAGDQGSAHLRNLTFENHALGDNLGLLKETKTTGINNLEQSLFNKMSVYSNQNNLIESKNFNN